MQLWQEWAGPVAEAIALRAPSVILALVALLVGWVAARVLGNLTRRLAGRVTADERVRGIVGTAGAPGAPGAQKQIGFDYVAGRVVYYLVMILVLVLFFDILGVRVAVQPLLTMANELSLAVPNLLKAILILLGAWVMATLVRSVTIRLLAAAPVARSLERIGVADTDAGTDQDQHRLAQKAGQIAYYLILIISLPAVLGALRLEGLIGPVEAVIGKALAYVPRLVAATLTVLIGYLGARLVRELLVHFLDSAGVDGWPARVGLGEVFRTTPLSRAIGSVAFAAILIPVVISALDSLGLTAVSDPAVQALTLVLLLIPRVLAALLILAVGVALARWVGQFTASLLESTNVSRLLVQWGLLADAGSQPRLSAILGSVVTGILILLTLVQVFDVLHLTELSQILYNILAYVPNAVVAVIILAAGYAVGRFARRSLEGLLAQTQYPPWLGFFAQAALIGLAGLMALEQLGVARSIVTGAFTILLGSVGLAFALAFGLGGREAVGRWLNRFIP